MMKHLFRLYWDKEPLIGHLSLVISHWSLGSKKVKVKTGAAIAIPIAKRIGSGNLLSHFVFGLGGE
jgi:hypothetical protein